MSRSQFFKLALTLGFAVFAATTTQAGEVGASRPEGRQAEELFRARIGPLLKERCVDCHGRDPKKVRGGLDLRSRETMLKGGESGEPAVVSGQPAQSLLYQAVTREDPTFAMPPK